MDRWIPGAGYEPLWCDHCRTFSLHRASIPHIGRPSEWVWLCMHCCCSWQVTGEFRRHGYSCSVLSA